MTNERTVPLLPCASIDDIETFYGVLGFRTTYKQRKPNACGGAAGRPASAVLRDRRI